jgi:hypothetical protein
MPSMWTCFDRMRLTRRTCPQVVHRSAFAGFRFPSDVIVLAVRWYLRFGVVLPGRLEELLDCGIAVDHVTIHRWVLRFSRLLADAARFARHRVGDRWQVDESPASAKPIAEPSITATNTKRPGSAIRDLYLAPRWC